MKTYVEFRSSAFPPYDGEDSETNPGIFGKRLAEFIFTGLKENGFSPLEPLGEDWGWLVEIKNDSFKLSVGCGNYEEYENGFLCFIEPHTPIIRRFLFFGKVDTTERVNSLQKALDTVLRAEPAITDIRWSTHEEFNRLGAEGENNFD